MNDFGQYFFRQSMLGTHLRVGLLTEFLLSFLKSFLGYLSPGITVLDKTLQVLHGLKVAGNKIFNVSLTFYYE